MCPGLNGEAHALKPDRRGIILDQPLPQEVRNTIPLYMRKGRCIYIEMEGMLTADFPDITIEKRQIRNTMHSLRNNNNSNN